MNPTGHWFKAAERVGENIEIRYGRLSAESDEPEWLALSHCDYDGIGGFAKLLRNTGADLTYLPQGNFPNNSILQPFLNILSTYKPKSKIALRENWDITESEQPHSNSPAPIAWKVFTEEETAQIRNYCREQQITVNSYLLKLLDDTVRVECKHPELATTWFIPVNIRGDVSYEKDTENHVSGIEPILSEDDTAQDIQQQILQRLKLAEHRRNHLILELTKWWPLWLKVQYLTRSRKSQKGSIGSFSNLGVWDSKKTIDSSDKWLFCPPVCKGQLLSAGCVCFQGQLSLAIQCHTDVQTGDEIVKKWMTNWVEQINNLP